MIPVSFSSNSTGSIILLYTGQVSLILIPHFRMRDVVWFLSTIPMYIAETEQVFIEDDVSILDVSCTAKEI